ncbi:hypothetical protein [Cytobacillus oceanisediminis]
MVISAGMDEMPFKACKEKGILVTNARESIKYRCLSSRWAQCWVI